MLTSMLDDKKGIVKKMKQNVFSPKFFFIQDLQKRSDIRVKQICSLCDNIAHLLTKSMPLLSNISI